MCGIAGIVRRDASSEAREDLVRMLSTISYRGPDAAGAASVCDGRIALGQVRLSIVDLGAGRQPMFDHTGELLIVFNGEIYDHQEKRRALEADGQVFRTRTDTEVILGLYRKYGLDFFSHLNGEFAFALWDNTRRRLLICRDRHGIKPLFYRRTPAGITFCSEAKGILGLADVPRRLSPEYLTGAMVGAWPTTTSTFEGIEALAPGHCLLIEDGEVRAPTAYWRPTYNTDHGMTFAAAKEGVRFHLDKAVRRRLVADVPVCVYLSGGIDSTLVASCAAALGQPVRAFTLGFTGSVYDETQRARQTAAHLGLPFEEVPCTPAMLAERIPEALFHTETCIGNAGPIGKMILSRQVRAAGFRVALTGEGADELFAGYPYFKLELLQKMMLSPDPEQVREAGRLWRRFQEIEHRSEGLLWYRRSPWRRMPMPYGYPSFLHLRAMQFARLLPKLLRRDVLQAGTPPDTQFLRNFPPAELAGMHQTHASLRMTLNWLSGYILVNLADRLEMANSIEGRPAFLDHEMAQFASTIPPQYLIDLSQLREKYVLHEAYTQTISQSVRNTHKHPFLSPSWRSLAKTPAGRQIFVDALSPKAIAEAGIFNGKQIAALGWLWRVAPARTQFSKRIDPLMGMVLSAQLLHQMFVAKRPAPAMRLEVATVEPPGAGTTQMSFTG